MLLYLNIGNVACGEPIFTEQNIIGYLDLTLDHEPSRKLFTLKYQRIEIMALLFLMQKDLEEL